MGYTDDTAMNTRIWFTIVWGHIFSFSCPVSLYVGRALWLAYLHVVAVDSGRSKKNPRGEALPGPQNRTRIQGFINTYYNTIE